MSQTRRTRLRGVASYALVVVAAALLWPSSLGGCMTTVVVSGISMEPTYHPGDAVVAWCGSPHAGDVVVYRPSEVEGVQIIHRIVGGTSAGWVTEGDNNTGVDPFRPTNHDVVGVARLHVPGVGTALHGLTSPFVWVTLVAAGAITLVWPGRRVTSLPQAAARSVEKNPSHP